MPMMTKGKAVLIAIKVALTSAIWLVAAVILVLAWAAWADFRFMECREFLAGPALGNANCVDARDTMWIGGIVGGVFAVLAGLGTWIFWDELRRKAHA